MNDRNEIASDHFDLMDKLNKANTQIEFMRDFIIWLCEEELNETVSECEERFDEWQKNQDNEEIKTEKE